MLTHSRKNHYIRWHHLFRSNLRSYHSRHLFHDSNDELGVQAVVMVVSRADDSSLILVYDSLNHRNGNWTNTITLDNEEERWQKTTADKTIEAGEQIYNSYNMCENCGGRKMDYGTAGKFGNSEPFEIQKSIVTKSNL